MNIRLSLTCKISKSKDRSVKVLRLGPRIELQWREKYKESKLQLGCPVLGIQGTASWKWWECRGPIKIILAGEPIEKREVPQADPNREMATPLGRGAVLCVSECECSLLMTARTGKSDSQRRSEGVEINRIGKCFKQTHVINGNSLQSDLRYPGTAIRSPSRESDKYSYAYIWNIILLVAA